MVSKPIVIVALVFLLLAAGPSAFAEGPQLEQAESQSEDKPVMIPRGDGGITVTVSPEAAAELKAALRKPKDAKEPERENAASSTQSQPAKTEPADFNYDVEIYKANQSGNSQDVRILTLCRDTPTGGKLLTPAYLEAKILSLCKERDFEVESTDALWRPEISRSHPHSGSGAAGVSPAVAACRAETRKHVITCAKVTDYQNCETWGCPEIIECDKRLTSCDDHGSPFNESGNFYCDTRNWRTRDFDLNALLERTCPSD
ncbi:MAG: hypothetical protein CMK09_11300 [Ponticaulis sp.]|nr:hypothetical protein [Ponticaulis sp.]|tara:strand:- start:40340 stop:41116 length:777 start_codon:yes stop_codon:yes gene_type:complete